MEKIILQKM